MIQLFEGTAPQGGKRAFKYDPDRTIVSDCGTMHAIFTAPSWAKKPKILRIKIVNPANYAESIGYVTFSNQKHNYMFGYWNAAPAYNPGRIKNLTETGPALAGRMFGFAKAMKP